MADHDDSEQPRKKVRLSSPDGAVPLDASSQTDGIMSIADLIQSQLASEQKVGITAFAAKDQGFSCIVKQRYTDFLVNEIPLSGQVLHLEADALEKPKPEPKQSVKQKSDVVAAPSNSVAEPAKNGEANHTTEGNTQAQNGKAGGAVNGMHPSRAQQLKAEEQEELTGEQRKAAAIAAVPAEDVTTLESLFGKKTTDSIVQLYGKVVARPDRKARDFTNFPSEEIDDKQKRTDAHVAVRRIFKGLIDTVTESDNTITIKAAAPMRQQNHARSLPQNGTGPKVKGKVGWDELGGEHLHFTLYKENKDSMEVLYYIASQLKMHAKALQMAGTKDRRGVTVQRISAYRVIKAKLQGLNSSLRGAKLGGFEYRPSGLELGDLVGNEFTMTLRDCQIPGSEGMNPSDRLDLAKKTIGTAMESFQRLGFINYYGLQRFGTFATSTDDIGKKMLQGNLKGAVEGILTYSPAALEEAQQPTDNNRITSDDMARAKAISVWNASHKVGPALDLLPKKFQAESAIMRHLGWADRKTGRQDRIEDWQGALMGIARNLRMMYVHAYQSLVWNTVAAKRWEMHGNKVVEGDLILIGEHGPAKGTATGAEEEEFDEDGEVIVRPAADDSATALDDKFERARPLSKTEAESGRYTIFDLVLPLPGYDVVYPGGDLGAFYKAFMASEEGGRLNPLDMRRRWKDVSLSGGYRKIMARPASVAYQVRSYARDDEQMVQTDLERLLGKAADGEDVTAAAGESAKGDADKIALVLKLQLGSSQYATMALRELTKGGAIGYKPEFQAGR